MEPAVLTPSGQGTQWKPAGGEPYVQDEACAADDDPTTPDGDPVAPGQVLATPTDVDCVQLGTSGLLNCGGPAAVDEPGELRFCVQPKTEGQT
jgi:hypothetical protein